MSLIIEKSAIFETEVTNQFAWYARENGEALAWRFYDAIDKTLLRLSRRPDLGRPRQFRNPVLHGLRSFRVEPPFDKLLIFYRATDQALQAWRMMHGARNLPRRLTEPPGSGD